MARTLTPRDVHAIMNALVKQATGQETISVVDTSTFISAGERVLATGVENTLNSLSIVLGRTFMAVRPYQARLAILDAMNTGEYTSRMRKISFYSREAQAAGDWNTQLFTNLENGYDNGQNGIREGSDYNSTKSMWVQNQPIPLEMNFGGVSVWQDSTTVYKYQLKQAFRNESEFASFVSGIMTEKGNDIESQKEAWNRSVLLNGIAATYDMDKLHSTGSVINLTKEFNDRFNTSYTSAELLSTHLDDFLKFFVSTFKKTSNFLALRSARYHWSPAMTDNEGNSHVLLRHTPKNKQRLMLYRPLFIEAEAWVLPEIFNDQYLDVTNYEGVDYWQANIEGKRDAISVTPAITDATTGTQTAGNAVALDHVVGVLFDKDAIMTDFVLEDAETTPMEARKRYYNIWWSFAKNGIYDPTENFIVFTMEDE